jgi:hypothetical protein
VTKTSDKFIVKMCGRWKGDHRAQVIALFSKETKQFLGSYMMTQTTIPSDKPEGPISYHTIVTFSEPPTKFGNTSKVRTVTLRSTSHSEIERRAELEEAWSDIVSHSADHFVGFKFGRLRKAAA